MPPGEPHQFDAFLDCGILADGFLRLLCEDCAHEKLVGEERCVCPVDKRAALRTTGQDEWRVKELRAGSQDDCRWLQGLIGSEQAMLLMYLEKRLNSARNFGLESLFRV